MDRIRTLRLSPVAPPATMLTLCPAFRPAAGLAAQVLALAALWAAFALAARPAHAQPGGGPATYNVQVVDQFGRPLNGSVVRVEGTSIETTTPGTITVDSGPQLFTIEPAFQGAMLPGGSWHPTGANAIARSEFLFLDPMGGDLVIEWRTADVTPAVEDQFGVAIPGASWALAGEGSFASGGTLVSPVTDESVYPTMSGAAIGGFTFTVRAAFDGQPVDLTRPETREVTEGTTNLDFEWRQTACTMGVVDGTEAPIRGATWTVFGHTFAAGDAIVLPTTDDGLYAGLAGAVAAGFPATLFTNTPAGTGSGTFEVNADGSLSPAFITIGGGSFGLRCGVSPFPPITTGTLAGLVTADGAPFAGASLTVLDANGTTTGVTTDGAGAFTLTDVPQGSCTVTLAVPAGFHAVDPASGSATVTIVAEATTSVMFSIAHDDDPPPPVVNNPLGSDYWRKEVRAALRGSGDRSESFEDMAVNFPQAIFDQFARRDPDPLPVEGVTQVDPDGTGPEPARRLSLIDMETALTPGHQGTVIALRRELLTMLLNVVSNRLSLNVVLEDGATVEERIEALAKAINSAKDPKGKGRITLHSDSSGLAASATGGVGLTMTLDESAPVTVDVYNASGRHVARIYSGTAPAGTTELVWQRGAAQRGIYFARLVSGADVSTARLIARQ
ncbi:MAG: carboxypeptidase regulatory-like domain-containing protein [Candidatus Eiseniibacteriota bacterium]